MATANTRKSTRQPVQEPVTTGSKSIIKINFRKLCAEEIEVQLVDPSPEGAKLLLHAKAEAVRQILDEQFGTFGWSCSYTDMGDERMSCTIGVSIQIDSGEMIHAARSGVGAKPLNGFDGQRGMATDAFKRAARMLGIGDELMTDNIIIPRAVCETYEKDGREMLKSKGYKLTSITYGESGVPSSLTIISASGKEYIWNVPK